ncbi:MAG: GatB/YqeY domain-containing protein, partial [Akkermansiaceae bacterium]
ENYLPAAMSEAEIISAVEAAIAETGAESRKDMGNVMKVLQEKTGGRADGKVLSQEVMKRLS